jgi:hypothetical protein
VIPAFTFVLAFLQQVWCNPWMSTEFTPHFHSEPAPPPTSLTKKGPSDKRFGIFVFLVTLLVGFLLVFSGPLVRAILPALYAKPQILQTKAVMKSLEIGVKGYMTEYLRLPYPGATSPLADNAPYSTTGSDGKDLLDVLLGSHAANNPRSIRFWDAPPPKPSRAGGFMPGTGLTDPWGNEYRIVLDYDGDGLIADPAGSGGTITASVLIYSAGPDKDFTTLADNVWSWK